MAIQLNDRDHLIFKLIDEHQVLLEKHISWFISGEDKPVLIRDRLRKLFYLDYLLCHRHGTKLPWWTTPTKPLVYMLSPMSRTISGFKEESIDLFDSEVQRHLLEVANLRMMHLIGVKDGEIANFEWTTCKRAEDGIKRMDAIVSFATAEKTFKFGIINHPTADAAAIDNLESALSTDLFDSVLLVSRDEAHQADLQKLVAASSISKRCFFSTHHELYKSGITKAKWQCADDSDATMFHTTSNVVVGDVSTWNGTTNVTAVAI